jgi:uncharacterized protein Yka (UPF0111/DUF47 family)
VTVKVEKPFVESNEEDWYDIVKIKIDKQLFKNELNLMSTGSIIGVKGRIKNESNNMQLVAERVQVF